MTTMKVKTLNLDTVVDTLPVDTMTINDPANLLPGSTQVPFTLPELDAQPHEIRTLDWGNNIAPIAFSIHPNLAQKTLGIESRTLIPVRYLFPVTLQYYKYIRFDLEYEIVVHSSYNQTGMLGVYWHFGQTFYGTEGNPLTEQKNCVSYWNQPACRRTEIALGRNSTTKIRVPYVSSSPMIGTSLSIKELSTNANIPLPTKFPDLVIEAIAPVHAVSGALQNATVRVYLTPINVKVGGFIGTSYVKTS